MSAKSAASAASASAKSAASDASASARSISATATGAAAQATAAATDAYRQTSTFTIVITTIAVTTTLIAGILAAIYYSGYADDIGRMMAKKYYEGKAQAEAAALGKMGSEKANAFLKDSLKKNPVMGEDELEQVSGGLGKEAAQQGLAGVSGNLGKLGGGLGKAF